MSSPDKAELGLQLSQAPENPKKNGHIPRCLLNPVFAVRLTLATLTGLGAASGGDFIGSMNTKVSAATPCTGSLIISGFRYFDRYPVDKTGRKDLVDTNDFILYTSLPEQKVNLYDKNKNPFNPPKSAVLQQLQPGWDILTKGQFQIISKDRIYCDFVDAKGRDGATFYLEFETDRGSFYIVRILNGIDVWRYVGTREDDRARLVKYLENNNNGVSIVGKSIAQQTLGQEDIFALEENPGKNNPEANKKIIREFIDQDKKKGMDWWMDWRILAIGGGVLLSASSAIVLFYGGR